MKASQLFFPTLREAPADAEAASHRLALRAALVRPLSAGVYTFLPLGWRVQQKIIQIIHEEMDAIGGQEMLAPVLTPAELWQRTGRYDIPEVFKLSDRNERLFVLPMTHEETFTFHAKEIRSYRELPKILYHFSSKFRDEPRPRGGLMRVREFVMKDSYSFDRDEEGLEASFQKHAEAYRRIFERCGLETYQVEADVGIMGGSASDDFLAPAELGENFLVRCERGDYAADIEIARGTPRPAEFPEPLPKPEPVETPNVGTIEDVSRLLGIDPAATAKAMPVVVDGKVLLALVRGDDRLSESKLLGALGATFRPSHPEEIRAAFGAEGGSIGPVGAEVEVVADEVLCEGQYVVGANRDGWHLRGVEPGRDFQARFADIREVKPDDRCPSCGGALTITRAIEVGHIFKLGTRFSVPLGATYLDESGKERPIVMGSYGIGPARTMAAVIEQHHDELGIAWPRSVTPFDVHVVALQASGAGVLESAESVAGDLESAGYSVLLDDREARAGEKFADADLIGCPVRITVGKKTLEDDAVDVRVRATGAEERVPVGEVATRAGAML